jgi:hypothetical protein
MEDVPTPDSRALGFVAVALAALAWACWWLENRQQSFEQSREDAPTVAEAQALNAGEARDGGTADVGDTAMTSQEAFWGVIVSAKIIAVEVPEKPLPWQRLAPCVRRGEVEINGGCWKRQADILPPCDEGDYEWRSACYRPVPKGPRAPTAKKP